MAEDIKNCSEKTLYFDGKIMYTENTKTMRVNQMKKRRIIFLLGLTVLPLLLFTGCIPGDGKSTALDPAGFFWGIWHGWIAPLSLIISIFKDNISIYEIWNTGFWYDFGFYIAVISGFGGLSLSRKRKKKKSDDHSF